MKSLRNIAHWVAGQAQHCGDRIILMSAAEVRVCTPHCHASITTPFMWFSTVAATCRDEAQCMCTDDCSDKHARVLVRALRCMCMSPLAAAMCFRVGRRFVSRSACRVELDQQRRHASPDAEQAGTARVVRRFAACRIAFTCLLRRCRTTRGAAA